MIPPLLQPAAPAVLPKQCILAVQGGLTFQECTSAICDSSNNCCEEIILIGSLKTLKVEKRENKKNIKEIRRGRGEKSTYSPYLFPAISPSVSLSYSVFLSVSICTCVDDIGLQSQQLFLA